MAAGRGPRAVLGVTLIACGGALVFLALHRQVELIASMSPWPGAASLVARSLQRRAYLDLETWGEAGFAVILLVVAGRLLVARATEERRIVAPAVPAHSRELERERERSAKADQEIASLRAELRSLRAPPPTARIETNGTTNGVDGIESHIVLAETPAEPPPAVGSPFVNEAHVEHVEHVQTHSSGPPRRSSYPELRHELRFSAHVEVDFESDSHFYTGLTENLSEGGLFIATYSPRPVGTEIDLTLRLPHQPNAIRTRGTVRWIREFSESSDAQPGMGVRLAMRDGDLARVRQFLSTRPPLFFDDD